MTEGSQEFCLRWNNHQATIISVFDYLLENETLVDCTLAAEGQYLKAHKVVLCACSPYLELLLSQHNDKHPILIFKDIKFSELKSMIEYMYKGEVNIAQDQLNHFLKAAESLQIKGLSESEEESTPTAAPTPRPPPPRAPPVQRTQPRPIPNTVALPDPHPESPKRLNRNEAVSPSRKRRRQVLPIQGRPSLSGDDASNASEGHLDQSNCDVPSAALATSDNSVAKVESNSELMLEPKTEYDDNSVEDITLDDDEEDYSQAGTSMDNSQMNFSGWQQMVGDKSGDDVFAGQDTGAQNSQDSTENSFFTPVPIKCEVTENISPPLEENQDATEAAQNLSQAEPFQSGPLDFNTEAENYCVRQATPQSNPLSPDRQSPIAPDGQSPAFVGWPERTSKVRIKRTLRRLLPPQDNVETRRTSKTRAQPNFVSFRCHSCDFVTRNKKLLNYHVNQTHVAQSLQGKPFSCQYCRYRCKSPSALNMHVGSVHYTDTLIDKIADK